MTDGHPRELLILRHGKSSWDSSAATDFERPLAKRGRRDAPRMGAWLAERHLVPDLVLCSPATRARETAEAALEVMEENSTVVSFEQGIYGAYDSELVDLLGAVRASARRVLLVGHNPGLEDLLLRLASEPPVVPVGTKRLPTCALAHLGLDLAWDALAPGCATLLALVRPKEL